MMIESPEKWKYYSQFIIGGSYLLEKELMSFIENHQINVVVDLTTDFDSVEERYDKEKIPLYINFPIKDNSVPNRVDDFIELLKRIYELVNNKQKVYIHCRGGHGRSGLVIASIFKLFYNMDSKSAIALTTYIHNTRQRMRKCSYDRGSPNNMCQRLFVENLSLDSSIKALS